MPRFFFILPEVGFYTIQPITSHQTSLHIKMLLSKGKRALIRAERIVRDERVPVNQDFLLTRSIYLKKGSRKYL